jgi:putative alpha-1,2-mannosidase
MWLVNGQTVTLKASDASAPYVGTLNVNGKATTKSWTRFADVQGGAVLDFSMTQGGPGSWGTGASDVPPSFAP